MGSATSVQSNYDDMYDITYNSYSTCKTFDSDLEIKKIYISFDSSQKNNQYIKKLCKDLTNLNCDIKCSEYNDELSTKYTSQEISKMVENIINQTSLLIVCISKNSIRSYLQSIEINIALDSNKNILYIMTDKDYASVKYNLLNGIIRNNTWCPLYDDKSLTHLIKYLVQNYI